MYTTYANNLNLSKFKPIRAGIIPFVITPSSTFFIWAIDYKWESLIDFGGSVEKSDKDCIEAAIREYREESLDCVYNINRHLVLDKGIAVVDNDIVIFL